MARTNPQFFESQTYYKTPTELVNVDLDFADDIPASDSIKAIGSTSGTTASAVDSSNADASSTVIAVTVVSGTKVRVKLRSGVADEDYVIKATAEMTTSGEKFDRYAKLKVRVAAYV